MPAREGGNRKAETTGRQSFFRYRGERAQNEVGERDVLQGVR